jgi:flagellar protein FliO/FliZ
MDLIDMARYLGALLLVLGLVGCAALAARRFGVPGIASRSATRRLAVVETLMIDARHKVFLLKRDDREHLLIVGPEGSRVIESGIVPAATAPAASVFAQPPGAVSLVAAAVAESPVDGGPSASPNGSVAA